MTPDPIKSPDNWTFRTPAVANDFDAHVIAHLPWYALASDAVALAVKQFLPERGSVYEIGCSNGNIARRIKDIVDARDGAYIGIDNSADMFGTIRMSGDTMRFLFELADATNFKFEAHDVFVSMLTMIFIAPAARQDMLRGVWNELRPGGAIIGVERFAQHDGESGQLRNRMTLNAKRVAGVSDSQIAAKEFSLVGVQRPMSPSELPGKSVPFFRFGDFVGFICIKS